MLLCVHVCFIFPPCHYSDSSISGIRESTEIHSAPYRLSGTLLFTVHCSPFHRSSLLPASLIFKKEKNLQGRYLDENHLSLSSESKIKMALWLKD